MPVDQKVDYLEFPAGDLASIQSFYEKAFGWTFTDYGPDYKAFSDGKIDGGFYQSEQHSSVDHGAVLVVLFAVDLEKTREAVLSAGGKIIRDIFNFPGGRRFHFTDPNGNELAVWAE
jgi:uncharacterized protein